MIDLPQSRIALANGIELDVCDMGPRDAPALIFLHGFPENHRTWRHQLAHFCEDFRCIAPDQRGYRGSSKPLGKENYQPDQLIGDVFLLAEALGVEQFTIVGHDWGGAIAWGVALAGQAMGKTTRAIIANAPHPAIFPKLLWTNRHQRESSQYMRSFRDSSYDPMIAKHGLGPFLKEVTDWQETGAMEPEERALLLADWENPEAALAMLNWYRATPLQVPAMDEPFALPSDFAAPEVPRLTIPTLVIWGMDDLALPPENLQGMDQLIDDFTLAEIPDASHFVTWGASDAVNAAMAQFLKR